MEPSRQDILIFFAVVLGLPAVLSYFVIRWRRQPEHSPWANRLVFWPLAALGAFICLGLAQQELVARRPALGTGVVVFGFVPILWRGAKAGLLWARRHWDALPPR